MADRAAEQYVNLSQQLIYEVASGMEEPVEIAARYGIAAEDWGVISKRPDVQQSVALAKAELEKNGTTFRNMAKMMATEAMKNLYRATLSNTVPVKDKVAATKALVDAAGLGSSAQQVSLPGQGFSITINIPAPSAAPKAETFRGALPHAGAEDVEVVESGVKLPPASTPDREPYEGHSDAPDVKDLNLAGFTADWEMGTGK